MRSWLQYFSLKLRFISYVWKHADQATIDVPSPVSSAYGWSKTPMYYIQTGPMVISSSKIQRCWWHLGWENWFQLWGGQGRCHWQHCHYIFGNDCGDFWLLCSTLYCSCCYHVANVINYCALTGWLVSCRAGLFCFSYWFLESAYLSLPIPRS